MIDISQYKRILEAGLLLDHYMVLRTIREGTDLPSSRRVQGFVNLLIKKDYILSGVLTEKAISLLNFEPTEVTGNIVTFEAEEPVTKFDYAQWTISLHRKIAAKLKESTGKTQVKAELGKQKYNYLPNPADLGKVILRAITGYKLKDLDKVERTILKQVDQACKDKVWFPLIGYYIMKGNLSQMVTDMDTVDTEETSGDDTIVNI